MTNDKREALIEEAAKALAGLTDAEWDIATAEGTDHLAGYFEAAEQVLAVFEAAQKPTTDEREHMAQVIRNAEASGPVFASTLADVILAAGFRRPVQGEPTDAQVRASLHAFYAIRHPMFAPGELEDYGKHMVRAMRAALRAAFQTGENR